MEQTNHWAPIHVVSIVDAVDKGAVTMLFLLWCILSVSRSVFVNAWGIPIFSVNIPNVAKFQEAITLTKMMPSNMTAAFKATKAWKNILETADDNNNLDISVKRLAKRMYASCCVRIGQDEDAIRAYISLLKYHRVDSVNQEYCDLKIGIGRCYQRLLRYREATEAFREAGAYQDAALCGLRLGDLALVSSLLQNLDALSDSHLHKETDLLRQVLSLLSGAVNEQVSPLVDFLAGNVITFNRYAFHRFCEANNAGFDDPLLLHLDDKVLLHNLLSSSELSSSFWPRGATILQVVESEDSASSVLCVAKKRAGYGSHGNSIVRADLEIAIQQSTMAEVSGTEQILLQEMIQPPLLIQGRKFSLRVFVVRVGTSRSFLFLDGLVKLASTPWSSSGALMSQQMTNSGRSDSMDQKSLSLLYKEIGTLRYQHIWDQITEASTNVLSIFDEAAAGLSVDGSSVSLSDLAAYRRCVDDIGLPKILGFDFMVDEKDHVWLLEVNRFPGLEPRDTVDDQVKKRLVKATWENDFDGHFLKIV